MRETKYKTHAWKEFQFESNRLRRTRGSWITGTVPGQSYLNGARCGQACMAVVVTTRPFVVGLPIVMPVLVLSQLRNH